MATDVDGDTLTASLAVNNGTLSATLTGAATISAGENNSAAISIQGKLADVNATLASIQYTGNPDFFGNDTLTYYIGDGTVSSSPQSTAITVANVQDAWFLIRLMTKPQEDTPVVVDFSGSDPDGDDLTFTTTGSANISVPGRLLHPINPGEGFRRYREHFRKRFRR